MKYYALHGSLNWEAVRFHLLMPFLEPCGSRKDASYKNTFNSFYCLPLPAASFVFICRFAASAKRDRNGFARYRRIFLFQSIRFPKRIIANGNCLMYDIPSSPTFILIILFWKCFPRLKSTRHISKMTQSRFWKKGLRSKGAFLPFEVLEVLICSYWKSKGVGI